MKRKGGGLTCTPLSPVFGARVSGLDTSRAASAAEAAEFRALLRAHKLVVIPGGRLSVTELATFGRSLGLGPSEVFGAQQLGSYMSGFAEEPSVLQLEYGPDSPPADINLWHQDHSWRGEVTRYELSYADVAPLGGDVLFADATRAHATLSPRLRSLLEGATALCVLAHGYQNLEPCGTRYAEVLREHPPVEQHVIAVDRETGRRWLNVNAGYSVRIPELSAAESAALLPMLCSHATRPDHCVRLQYAAGDVVVFDNHLLQHYAVSDYYPAARRVLRMSFNAQRIVGAPSSPLLRPADALPAARAADATKDDAGSGAPPPPLKAPKCAERAADEPPRTPLTAHAAAVAELATQLAAGLRLLARGGQADLCAGFFAARHPARAELFLAPSHGIHWNEATPDAFGVYRAADRGRVAGAGPMPNYPSTAVSAAIFAALPDVHAIVHAHPRSMMALAALDPDAGGRVLPMSEPSFMFFERVAYLPCNFFFDDQYLEQARRA